MPFGMTCKEFEAADWRALEDSFTKEAEEEGGCDTFEKETGTTCPDSPGHMPGSVLRCLGTERRAKAS